MTKNHALGVFRSILGDLGKSGIRRVWNFSLQTLAEHGPALVAGHPLARQAAAHDIKVGAKALGHELEDNAIHYLISIGVNELAKRVASDSPQPESADAP